MATNIAEALQGAGAVSAKPVTLEAIPEATIDVGGGSQSLDIEGLGVKRRKDDLSVATASTSQLAVEDLFGDLLDEVNFSDPSSVDAFRESAASRINEFDLNTFSNILGEASTVASDLATLTSQFQRSSQPQQQFEQVFGPPSVTSGDDAGDIGLDTATSTEAQDISDLTNPGLAAGLVGGAFGAIGPGAGFSGLATNLASQAIGQADVVGALGGFSSVSNALNTEINDIPSAIGATATALSVGQQAAKVADLVNSNVTVTSLFEKAAKNVEEFIGGIVSAVSNPAQTIEAFGLEMAYGTTTPDLYSFDFPGGKMSFAFDAKTGAIAVPGMIGAIMGRSPLGTFYDLAQVGLEKFGYNDAMADRNQSAINAFSMPGVQFDQMSIHTGPQGATTGVDPETGVASSVGAFSAVDMSQQGYGMVGFDLGAMADAIGTGTIGDLGFTDFQDVAISGHLGHGPLDFGEEEALAADITGAFSAAGISTAEDLSNAIDQAGLAAQTFTSSLQSYGIDITNPATGYGALDRASALSMSSASAAREALATDPQAFEMARIDALDPAAQLMTQEEIARQARAQRAERSETEFEGAGQSMAEDYNSQTPSNQTIDVMATLGITSISANANADLAKKAAIEMELANRKATAEQEKASGLSFGYGPEAPSIGTGGVSAPGYEAAGQAAAAEQAAMAAGVASYDIGYGYDIGDIGEDAGSVSGQGDPDAETDFGEGETDESDTGAGPDGGGGGGDGKVICTALKDMGLLDKELWQHDGAYGRTLPLETRQGYWAWGVPTAKFIRKNRWAAKAIRPVVTEVAKEMAHRVGYGKGSKLGAALLYVGLPMCRVISRIKNNGSNTGSVYS